MGLRVLFTYPNARIGDLLEQGLVSLQRRTVTADEFLSVFVHSW